MMNSIDFFGSLDGFSFFVSGFLSSYAYSLFGILVTSNYLQQMNPVVPKPARGVS